MVKFYTSIPKLIRSSYSYFGNKTNRSLYKQLEHASTSIAEPGLFGHDALHASKDFLVLSKRACSRAQDLVTALLTSNYKQLPNRSLHLLDSISNELCAIVDVAELCRNIHSDQEYKHNAEIAFTEISTLIHNLNANKQLYRLIRDLESLDSSSFSEEEKTFLRDLRLEYEAGGIHLDEIEQKSLVDLQSEIVAVETAFLNEVTKDNQQFELRGLPISNMPSIRYWLQQYIQQIDCNKSQHEVVCSSSRRISLPLLRSLSLESNRRDLWYNTWHEPYSNINLLGELVQKRQQLAFSLNQPSYSHKFLQRQAAKEPATVAAILKTLSDHVRPRAQAELNELLRLKRSIAKNNCTNNIQPWDVNYYSSVYSSMVITGPNESLPSARRSSKVQTEALTSYFPLKRCLEGIAMLCHELFAIELVSVPLGINEGWVASSSNERHATREIIGLYKFNVYNNPGDMGRIRGDLLGTFYLDLFQRPGKFPGSAMFSIQCASRESIYPYLAYVKGNDKLLGNDSIPFQLPRSALVLNLARQDANRSSEGSLLSLHEVETLHHEFGHLLHSLLSRTQFQHLSGTRTALDFSEVPSHLFEYFARTESVVRLWARHVSTNTPLPSGLLADVIAGRNDLAGIDLQTQILFSAGDQHIFGANMPNVQCISSEESFWRAMPGICEAQKELTCLPFANNPYEMYSKLASAASSEFNKKTLSIMENSCRKYDVNQLPYIAPSVHSHFVNYGAGYYSYLFARLYAAQIWQRQFANNPLSSDSGEKLRRGLLEHGASKDASTLLNNLAGGPLDPTHFIEMCL